MDFSTYKFRASGVGNLMVEPRSKSESLSETTRTYLRDIYIKEVYGRSRDTSSKYTEKGLFVEEDSFNLMQKHFGKLLIKNKTHFENEFVKGTPDIVMDNVKDAKSSWDMHTFFAADGTDKTYYWQLQTYMWLTDKDTADLCYCLNNSPEHLIVSEKNRRAWQKGLQDGTPEFEEMELDVELNMKFDDIPAEKRIRIFSFDRDQEDIDRLIIKIEQAREYLNYMSFVDIAGE